MVEVRRVSDDAFVFFVEGVHGPPCERHASVKHVGKPRQRRVPPRRVIGLTPVDADGVPVRLTEVAMLGDSLFCGEDAGLDVAARKVGDRIAARLVQQHHILTVGDVPVAEADPHPAAQRLREQNPLRHWLWCEEAACRSGGQWSLLPCQSHSVRPSPQKSGVYDPLFWAMEPRPVQSCSACWKAWTLFRSIHRSKLSNDCRPSSLGWP